MRKNQERCDACGRFVPECSLLVDGDDSSRCICEKCDAAKLTTATIKEDTTVIRSIVEREFGNES